MKTLSYVHGEWVEGQGDGKAVFDAVTGEQICQVSSDGIDFQKVLDHGRDKGGPALRAMTTHARGAMLKELGKHLMSKKDDFYALSDRKSTR